ncbi:MSHA biogenesis protein MshP [Malonomonas rubra DSM 5091]|uniref:MSHA biogenesis protein MshP n=1 Tax=Malonomonas rubra DSM 5091 TaxID=1122189 RepID=A0A1M6M714_MALRU|nr:pilus assembly protein MshP [Malonomonas rubra]SHJ79043.1 MSHA biogenesis protein MshP [Malonomonas rubra DSM 5091]
MKNFSVLKNESGFTLVQAVFILVVLAVLGVAMMRLSGIQSSTSIFALQGARAYQAARSGLDWGASRASIGSCSTGSSFAIGGFSISVDCSSQSFNEGSGPYDVYTIKSTATFGSYGSPDYVSRRLEMKVGFP